MIWKTKTHQYSATVCQKTGKTCPALAQMARAVVQAMEAAIPATSPDFEFEGGGELGHCPQGCEVRYKAKKELVRVFCGAGSDASIEVLEDYADMLFGPDFTARPAQFLAKTPCAMLEVSELVPSPVAQPEQQLVF